MDFFGEDRDDIFLFSFFFSAEKEKRGHVGRDQRHDYRTCGFYDPNVGLSQSDTQR